MGGKLQRLLFAVPEGQRYSCGQCNWCCRWWRIELSAADRDRLQAHDWAAESPRLSGVQLFEEQQPPGQPDPVIQTAQMDGQCIFLEGDGLCLIHRVLGPEAKPTVCQGFPLMLGRTVDGVLVGANYACSALVRNEGEPFARQEPFVLELLEREPADGVAPGREVTIDSEPLLSGATRLSWRAYLELERSLLEILAVREYPVASRLVAAGALVSALAARSTRSGKVEEEDAGAWLAERRVDGYTRAFARAADIRLAPPMRQRAMLGPLIADVETAAVSHGGWSSKALGYAAAIANGAGDLQLSTLRGSLDLAAMGRVSYDQDSPRLEGYLTRFLRNFVMRKSLLESESLTEACDYLCLYFALIRWYAIASAAMSRRAGVEDEDLIAGIQVVEKVYLHRMGLRSGFRRGLLSTLLRWEMRFLVRPPALVMGPPFRALRSYS